MNKVLGYLGPKGTFSEEAAHVYKNSMDENLILKPCRSIEQVLYEVEQGLISEGIVPIENSIEGSLGLVLDMLVHDVNLFITKEIISPISHHLMTKKGIKLLDIELILSHPQAIAQSRKFIGTYLPNAEVLYTSSTAEAAAMVAESEKPYAVIGNRYAGEVFGLEVLNANIQDVLLNHTRFIVVTREKSDMKGIQKDNKISIAFGLRDYPGSLVEVLQEFSAHQVNLTRIESRPSKSKLGEYHFYVDFIWHHDTEMPTDFIETIGMKTTFLKPLGFYKVS